MNIGYIILFCELSNDEKIYSDYIYTVFLSEMMYNIYHRWHR